MLSHVRVVLVRSIRSGNVGAIARAMLNMGLSDLVLVAPACDPLDEQALGFAARAKDLLRSARIVATLPEALADCVLAFATSSKGGLYRRQAGMSPAQAAELAVATAASGRVAIAFGPEDRGLLESELLPFDRVIEIPANPQYRALNLAAAGVVVCYELRQAWLRADGATTGAPVEPLASGQRKEILFGKLFDALERIGFFRGQQSPEHLRLALRRILGRCALTVNEADILIGMARQIRWYCDHHPPGRSPLEPAKGAERFARPDACAGDAEAAGH